MTSSLPTSSPKDFPSTSKSLVQRIQSPVTTESQAALEEFFSRYWLPFYSYLRASGESKEDSQDLVQGFIAQELLNRSQLAKWNPEQGRLRGFLKTCLTRYRKNDYRKETAQKRGGKKSETHFSIDFSHAETFLEPAFSKVVSPDEHYDRQWAAAAVNHAIHHLAQRYQADGKEREFQLFVANLQGRGDSEETVTYEKIATELDSNVGAIKQRMIQFRTRFEQSFRTTVGNQIGSGSVEKDVAYLLSLLQK